MQIHFKDANFDLSYTMVMGIYEIDPQVEFVTETAAQSVQNIINDGANFVEFRVNKTSAYTTQLEADLLEKALLACQKSKDVRFAAVTSEPLTMERCVKAGADLIIDPMALRNLGASEMIARLDVPVCLCFDKERIFDREHDFDPISAISEFFYERVDSCLRSGISRQKLLIDPMLGADTSIEARLKMYGRINSLNSFGIPLTCEIPRSLIFDETVELESDNLSESNLAVTIAVCLFAEKQGIRIIRTHNVYDIALALDTWQAMNYSARPFKLRNVFKRAGSDIHNKRLKERLSVIKGK